MQRDMAEWKGWEREIRKKMGRQSEKEGKSSSGIGAIQKKKPN